jgi:hypothetical protein
MYDRGKRSYAGDRRRQAGSASRATRVSRFSTKHFKNGAASASLVNIISEKYGFM